MRPSDPRPFFNSRSLSSWLAEPMAIQIRPDGTHSTVRCGSSSPLSKALAWFLRLVRTWAE